jgi:transcriptional regulator with XRE-family HTH domain
MKFSEQIKKLRKDKKLRQDDLAQTLHVSRQTISSWETDRNLPDLEMIVAIASFYHISLDELILGGSNMKEKLIKDGNEGIKTKRNLVMMIIASVLLLLGITCMIIKTLSVEYVDEMGVLHENFFLIVWGYLLIMGSIVTYIVAGIDNVFKKKEKR